MHFKPNMHSDGYLSYSNTQRKPRLPDISESSRGHAEVPPLASNSQASSADGNPIDISWWILDTPANMEQTELAALWSRLKNTESHSMIDLPSKVYANLRYGGVQRSRVYHRSPQKHRRFGAAHFWTADGWPGWPSPEEQYRGGTIGVLTSTQQNWKNMGDLPSEQTHQSSLGTSQWDSLCIGVWRTCGSNMVSCRMIWVRW